jgi:hypothetical protein
VQATAELASSVPGGRKKSATNLSATRRKRIGAQVRTKMTLADLGVLSLTDFLNALTEHDEILELGAHVSISSFSGSRRECADALAGKIREQMNTGSSACIGS